MMFKHASVAIVLGLGMTAGVSADQVRIRHTLSQGQGSGFGFSVLHAPSNANGNGNILYRMIGVMETVFDDATQTHTLTEFSAELYKENDLNPNTLGARAGSLTLIDGALNRAATTNLLDGHMTLHLSLDGSGEGEVTFLFKAISYNPLANRWDPDRLRIGLWGATADMFGEGPATPIGDTGITSLGIDMLTSDGMAIVPLPSGVALGSAGLFCLAGRRRRRA